MIIKNYTSGPISANTYIIIDENTGDAAVTDLGACTPEILNALKDPRIKTLKYILLTHGHFDHIDGVPELKMHYSDTPVCIHEEDAPCLGDDLLSLAKGFGFSSKEKISADVILHDGDILPFGNGEIKVIHTPGHTTGGVTYLTGDCLFTGDTLFYLSIGRTDLPGGNYKILSESVGKLFRLPGNYRVYPGHEQTTTLDFERNNNMYVKW